MIQKKKIVMVISIILVMFLIVIFVRRNSFVISDHYISKFENHKSYVDGPDVDYYVYDNKIIEESMHYYPSGVPHNLECEIIVYENVDTSHVTNMDDIFHLIKNQKGKIVLKKSNENCKK